jgi:hypothetical protein
LGSNTKTNPLRIESLIHFNLDFVMNNMKTTFLATHWLKHVIVGGHIIYPTWWWWSKVHYGICIRLIKWQEKNIIWWGGMFCYCLGGFTILMLSIMNVKMNHQPFKFLMESNQFIRKLDKFKSMILTWFISLVKLTKMLIDWIETQVPIMRTPLKFVNMMI